MIGKEFFSHEENLNLLSARQLRGMVTSIGLADGYQIRGVRLGGLVSNLLLILYKEVDRADAGLNSRHSPSHLTAPPEKVKS